VAQSHGEEGQGGLDPAVRRVGVAKPHGEEVRVARTLQQGGWGWQKLPEGAAVTRVRRGASADLSQTTAMRMASQPAYVEVCDLLLATPQGINMPPYLSSRLISKNPFLILYS